MTSTADGTTATADADLVAAWWHAQPPARRRQLLTLEASDPLPRVVASDLWRAGVSCPLVLRSEHGRLVRRALPPPVLVELLGREVAGAEDAA